jgi:hypothetical protein
VSLTSTFRFHRLTSGSARLPCMISDTQSRRSNHWGAQASPHHCSDVPQHVNSHELVWCWPCLLVESMGCRHRSTVASITMSTPIVYHSHTLLLPHCLNPNTHVRSVCFFCHAGTSKPPSLPTLHQRSFFPGEWHPPPCCCTEREP